MESQLSDYLPNSQTPVSTEYYSNDNCKKRFSLELYPTYIFIFDKKLCLCVLQ